jgi:hypothetical protein
VTVHPQLNAQNQIAIPSRVVLTLSFAPIAFTMCCQNCRLGYKRAVLILNSRLKKPVAADLGSWNPSCRCAITFFSDVIGNAGESSFADRGSYEPFPRRST